MAKVSNIIKVKVYPKDFKSIPDILPYRQLLQGDPVELELDKMEIWRCMNFGDVFDMTSGEEVLIDEMAWKDIVEFIDDESEDSNPDDGTDEGDDSDGDDSDDGDSEETEAEPALVNGAITEDTVLTK